MFTYACTNTKEKPLKTKAAVWFNKMCQLKQIAPNYIDRYIMNKNTS